MLFILTGMETKYYICMYVLTLFVFFHKILLQGVGKKIINPPNY